jgi:hypothetical protein
VQSFVLLSGPAAALWHPQLRKSCSKRAFHGHERTWQGCRATRGAGGGRRLREGLRVGLRQVRQALVPAWLHPQLAVHAHSALAFILGLTATKFRTESIIGEGVHNFGSIPQCDPRNRKETKVCKLKRRLCGGRLGEFATGHDAGCGEVGSMSQHRGVLSRWQQLTRLHVSDLSILNLRTPLAEGCGREPAGSELVRTLLLSRVRGRLPRACPAWRHARHVCVVRGGDPRLRARAWWCGCGCAPRGLPMARGAPLPALSDASC